MSLHTDKVDAYMEGFRRSDKPAILALQSRVVRRPVVRPSLAQLAEE